MRAESKGVPERERSRQPANGPAQTPGNAGYRMTNILFAA